MNKPSERIVVFVTPAQKRAIAATADGLGISVSELMRRAVIAFSATSDQVKAASIVDRLNAPREPDPLAQVLRKAARPLRHGRGSALRGTLAAVSDAADAAHAPGLDEAHDKAAEAAPFAQTIDGGGHADTRPPAPVSPLAAEPDVERAAREIAQAVAHLSAETADDAELSTTAETGCTDDPPRSLSSPFAAVRPAIGRDDKDEPRTGPAPEDGHFA